MRLHRKFVVVERIRLQLNQLVDEKPELTPIVHQLLHQRNELRVVLPRNQIPRLGRIRHPSLCECPSGEMGCAAMPRRTQIGDELGEIGRAIRNGLDVAIGTEAAHAGNLSRRHAEPPVGIEQLQVPFVWRHLIRRVNCAPRGLGARDEWETCRCKADGRTTTRREDLAAVAIECLREGNRMWTASGVDGHLPRSQRMTDVVEQVDRRWREGSQRCRKCRPLTGVGAGRCERCPNLRAPRRRVAKHANLGRPCRTTRHQSWCKPSRRRRT